MKTLFGLVFLSIAARGTTVYLDSSALDTTNNSGHATVDLTGSLPPNPGWAPALPGSDWISYGPTGAHDDPGYFSPRDGTAVTFTTNFILNGAITGATLDVLADDSTSVVLNGHTLIAADTTPGSRCANHPVGCLTTTEGIFTFPQLAPYLVDGANSLSFRVVQVDGSSFGLDFAGSVADGQTPEASTTALMGAGLLALVSRLRRK